MDLTVNRRSTGSLGVALALVLGACGGSDNPPDGADGSPGDDGGGPDADPGTGLTVGFAYLDADGNPVPGDEAVEFAAFKIKSMTMQLHKLKLIGDTAPSGGLESESCVLEFPWVNAPRVVYSGAPPGLYSELDFIVERTYHNEDIPPGFDDVRLSIMVEGEAFFDTGDIDFVYIEGNKVDVELWLDVEVPTGSPSAISVALDLEKWFTGVPWADLAAGLEDEDDDGGDDSSGPGPGPPGDDGGDEDDDGGGGPLIRIGMGGDKDAADLLRENLATSFVIRGE